MDQKLCHFFLGIFYLFVVSPGFLVGVEGNATGAPTTEDTCKNMTPKHGDLKPQAGPSPYTIYMSRTEVKPGETIKLMICSSKDKIKGFFLQGRKSDYEKEFKPMGTFVLEENSMDVKLVKCSKDGDTVTHVNNTDKDHVKVNYKAPMEPGIYVVLCTLAKNGGTFWTHQPSFKITVKA